MLTVTILSSLLKACGLLYFVSSKFKYSIGTFSMSLVASSDNLILTETLFTLSILTPTGFVNSSLYSLSLVIPSTSTSSGRYSNDANTSSVPYTTTEFSLKVIELIA